MKKYMILSMCVGTLLFNAACEKKNEKVDAVEEKEVASADWVEDQLSESNEKVNEIDAKTKQLEQEIAKIKLAVENQQVFKDVPIDHWAYVYVTSLYHQGIVGGVGNNLFAPSQSITRAQAAAMLVRAFQLPLSSKPSVFSDVPATHPFAREVMTAYEAGFFGGYPNNRFMPSEPMKRKHMAMVIQRAFKLQKNSNIPYSGYKDVNDKTEGAEAIQIISQYGIAQGSNGYFYPDRATTRADFATFMYRALNLQK
ncbi:S-layer homology domain-containing protein [Thermolongibacillus altinsuensis]|uniref:S-layer homology domain-containing protein n=1 Tax=Thermolongibacillus altinsuensis TaxID=575256 RepID=UPI00242A3190|nr:S-layer homology domain-containing protein [Thermolongibacillus altinsuensis]GMB09152.1 hypothetical protein B1no1_18620 [Thermolongibacillus altinsuensis]